ncbi:DUF6907 domain-containing protein [Streptomyces goshikiensis]|uniref:DUF6907 domain-containing protein n=1 Tax=Streptomyces TaxID=1883 RepID=UPI0013DDF4DA|nr:hypothetical protein [Streptomyces sp. ADI95-16]
MPTIDAGSVTLPEPPWCAGHADEHPGYRVDIHHSVPVPVPDGLIDLHAELVGFPFGTVPVPASIYIEIIEPGATLDPSGLREFAAALVTHAALIRGLADRLTTLRAGGAW